MEESLSPVEIVKIAEQIENAFSTIAENRRKEYLANRDKILREQKTLRERALGKFKNNAASIATTAVMIAGISLFLFAKECDTTRPIVEPIRGDGICMESEAYECNFDPTGITTTAIHWSDDHKAPTRTPYNYG